jgi:translation initiation factor 4A
MSQINSCDEPQKGASSSSKTTNEEIYEEFEHMKIAPNILRGIFTYGFEKPSTIQQKAIVPISTGKDIIAQSQSGTGKTGAFTIGILNNLEEKLNYTQAMILSPTRELAEQIHTVIKAIGQFTKYRIKLCVGGTITEKMDSCQILIGTPGRILDMLNHGKIQLQHCKIFTLDEADEMLSKGFKEQIYEIFQFIPKKTQILLFSATMPSEILELTKKFMSDPINILVKKEELTLEGIKQYYIQVEREDWKFDTLIDLYKSFEVTQCVIFCNSKQKVEMIAQRLNDSGYSVSGIHSDLANRTEIMREFKSGKTRMLITTDLLARGIDVQHISLVINYDIPKSKETYIHRIGRSGRFGRKGIALNFITTTDQNQLKEIEQFYHTQIDELPCDLKIN